MSTGKRINPKVPSRGNPNTVISGVDCESSVYVGSAVYMDALGVAHNALADDIATSNVIGIVESKADSTTCTIRFLGVTIDDLFAGLDITREYYLSNTTPGEVGLVIPGLAQVGHVVVKIGKPFTATKMLVNVEIMEIR